MSHTLTLITLNLNFPEKKKICRYNSTVPPQTNNNQRTDDGNKESIIKLRNNNYSLDIESEHLKIVFFISESKKKCLHFIKEGINQKRTPEIGVHCVVMHY